MISNTAMNPGQAAFPDLDRTMAGLEDGIGMATASVEKLQGQIRDSLAKAAKTAEQMASFNQANIEALTKSSQIVAAGMQDMGQTFAAAAKTSMDDMMGTLRAMATAKSVREAVELQSSLVRATMEKAVAQTGRLAEQSMKLSGQAFAPITARVSVATETFSRRD